MPGQTWIYIAVLTLVPFAACKSQGDKAGKASTGRISSTGEDHCAARVRKARADFRNHQLKYYYFGIVAPGKRYIDSMKSNFNIQVISRGCSPTEGEICYNGFVDSLLKK